jgi:hypothetical protein
MSINSVCLPGDLLQRFPRRASDASLTSSAAGRASISSTKVTTILKQATYDNDSNVPFPRTAGAVFGGNGVCVIYVRTRCFA